VVACHGLGASKESDKYLLLARELPAAGLALARFDFRGSGESGGALRDATVAGRIADLQAVLGHLRAHPRLDGRVGLLGSSLGGFVALRVAAGEAPADGHAFLPLVTWNAPASLAALGDTPAADAAVVGAALLAEVRAGRHVEAPAGVRGLLVVQGEADTVVPPGHGRRLLELAGEPRDLFVIPGADHRLSDPVHRRAALRASLDWFLRWLPPRR
jgi:dipeptidyl aminopeptidase/acylaminoacyl peptidase